jgi:hypothetical protein
MPYNVNPSVSDVKYFLNRYDGFKKEAESLIEKYTKPGFHYKWLLEHSLFSDHEEYNKLILICMSDEFGEEKRISYIVQSYF